MKESMKETDFDIDNTPTLAPSENEDGYLNGYLKGNRDGYDESFIKLGLKSSSVTALGANAFGVPVSTFTNWRWQMAKQVRNLEQAQTTLELSDSERDGFKNLETVFHAGVTPYYMSLMEPQNDSCPIRLQALPRLEELSDRLGKPDPLSEVDHSPVREVVHVYPDRVAFCVAQLCPVYCRYCFRKRRDDEEGLHFNRGIIDRGIAYIKSNPAIRDVLITGGDPFIASDDALDRLLARIREIPHVEVIRFGTRTPVTLPYRVTKKLCTILAKYHPIWVNTHFNCASEVTEEAQIALANLANAGIPIGNQAVLLKGINDSPEAMLQLCRSLIKNRVRPYYIFHAHMIAGTEHLRVPVNKGLEIMTFLRGRISGFGIPTFALDTPNGKIPLLPNHILGVDGTDLILQDTRGEIHREPDAWKTSY
ncbi:MAG: KamA family radical SAM protein [Pseudomonadota bacterium]